MSRFLASPRRRRRLTWLGVVVAVGLAVLVSFVFFRNTAPAHAPKFTKGKPSEYREPKAVKHSRYERLTAIGVATEFLRTALTRRDVDRSWVLTEASLHQGYTRAQWDTGNELPFPPYHYRVIRWKPDYSYRTRIGLQVALFPAKSEHQRAAVFYLDLRRHGSGKHERWLVSEFVPAPSSGSTAPGIGEGASDLHISLPTSGTSKSPLSATWLLLPLSAFSLIFLVPLGLGVRGFVRNRRAMREYEAAATYRSTSSPS